ATVDGFRGVTVSTLGSDYSDPSLNLGGTFTAFFKRHKQSLIIVSLVLFLIYGEPQQTVEEKRIQELEQSYSRLSLENMALKAKEKNLTQVLNITLTAKKLSDKDLANLRKLANISTLAITNLRTKWVFPVQGYSQAKMGLAAKSLHRSKERSCGYYVRIVLAVSHHRQSGAVPYLRSCLKTVEEEVFQELEQSYSRLSWKTWISKSGRTSSQLEGAQKDRIRYQLEGTELRRDKAFLEECINMYEKKCKEDFVQSLEGIPKVGSQVTTTIGENAKRVTENKRLNEDTTWCKTNRTNIIEENKKVLKQVQQTYDKDLERLLLDVTKLNGNKKLLENLLSVKEIEIKMLTDSVNDLNSSLAICKSLSSSSVWCCSLFTESLSKQWRRREVLEQSYNRLSLENVALKAKEKNLTQVLNVTLTGKKLSDKDLANLHKLANISTLAITNLRTKW
ncbi:hypothetical protein NFI96_008775, partial [Prochilodus magdalenae]